MPDHVARVSAPVEGRVISVLGSPDKAVVEVVPEDYSTQYYTGFPTPNDYYAYDYRFGYPTDTELILLRLHPTH